jgi:dihydroorotase-like cyclic amidohydrolase
LIIKHGYIALPGEKSFLPLDIEIEDSKIVRTGSNLSGKDIFDAEGLLISTLMIRDTRNGRILPMEAGLPHPVA